jgi:hypothetical protein
MSQDGTQGILDILDGATAEVLLELREDEIPDHA